jgi:uncharacterized RDD family membrane protein YckC
MKCPKCGYLGFEAVDRCRNCGYDFSLTQPVAVPELTLRSERPQDPSPLDDLALVDAAVPAPAPPTGNTEELPLFGPSDEPMITRPSPPRPPLAVRRATPEIPRLRTETRAAPMLDLSAEELEPDSRDGAESISPSARARVVDWHARLDVSGPAMPAPLISRVTAVAIDLAVLAIVDLIVVYFTMQICGITADDFGILPKGPLIAFMIVQNGGYLVAFTAGGQTLGKLATGIRVVSSDPSGSVDLGHSMVRTAVWLLLAIPAGLGFLTTLLSRDRRGLHDRCAGTRVVRAIG